MGNGSTHNFIQPMLAESLKLRVRPITSFRVFTANGDSLICSLMCPKVEVELQGKRFWVDLYILKIRGPELVLGLPWLQGLGKIVQDYKKMEMKFMHEEENVKLIGNNSLGLQSFEAPSPP